MINRIVILVAMFFMFGSIAGCYGTSVKTQCQVCKDLSEGKTEGSEWTGEYIHEKFQCKLEGGKVMLEHGKEWKACS